MAVSPEVITQLNNLYKEWSICMNGGNTAQAAHIWEKMRTVAASAPSIAKSINPAQLMEKLGEIGLSSAEKEAAITGLAKIGQYAVVAGEEAATDAVIVAAIPESLIIGLAVVTAACVLGLIYFMTHSRTPRQSSAVQRECKEQIQMAIYTPIHKPFYGNAH